MSRAIYEKDYETIRNFYGAKEISSELGLVVGAITQSKGLMQKAQKEEGGGLNVCRALEEMIQEGREKGILEGRESGLREGRQAGLSEGQRKGRREGLKLGRIEGIVSTYREFGAAKEAAAMKLRKECGLSMKNARMYVEKYWG